MQVISHGATRNVVLIGRWAVKWCIAATTPESVTSLYSWWQRLLRGALANLQERQFCHVVMDHEWFGDVRFCPVSFCCPGGFFLIMPRCQPLSAEQWAQVSQYPFCDIVERKRDSFGVLPNGKIVIVDYGS